MTELDLSPHEELDEIDRRTNTDGSVDVQVLEWEKNGDSVLVHYQTPTETHTDSMEWPKSNSSEYTFIRLIDQTPYNLRTAEAINENEVWLTADPDEWSLNIPQDTGIFEDIMHKICNTISDIVGNNITKIIGVIIWPVTLLLMSMDFLDQHIGKGNYDDEYISVSKYCVGSTIATLLWVFLLLMI